ncbi:MAP7 domain-containing protein 2 isoform X4 [Aphidius gifuensis]|uniref:MAP7 domain-containing protein 2 isoform X4 n=1 Tax=Aphidius gifuensis TaxID=684658 RepID=UPI001CDCC6C0|nr:MAP7 domain-containing protein 2 isoform X4 [Aphidius gifuensis]
MFSELCRETLRKAAICYNVGRPGSPSSPPKSPSPSTSPPPSPAKETKTSTNIELANVNRSTSKIGDLSGNITTKNQASQQQLGATNTFTDKREFTNKKFNTNENKREKRTSMLTDFSKKHTERRRVQYNMSDEERESRSSSCEQNQLYNQQNHDNYYRESRRYRKDSSGSSSEPDDSSTSGDEAGAAPEESNQRSSSAHHRHSLTKDTKRRSLYDEDSLDGDLPSEKQGRESSGSLKDLDRAKLVRERQNEERQRKLEELRNQALVAQKFREQREEERRRRIDELRLRDNDRRNQVEERKRLIWEAERERREAILRKNQEREARIEARKKNERSQIVFAFGSSTPRMLEPADTGGSTFWGTRRATSTTNVMMFSAAQPLTRRSSERELDGSKKRATSAGGLDRKPGEGDDNDGSPSTPSSSCVRVNRRRTDLMPTIPSPRDGPPTSRSSSAKAFNRSPGRTYSMSRLDQLSQPRKIRELDTLVEQKNNQQNQTYNGNQNFGSNSMSRSMSHLAATGSSKYLKRSDNSRSMSTLPGVTVPRQTRAEKLRKKAREQQSQQTQGVRSGEVTPNSPSRPHSSMSQQSNSSFASSNVNLRPRTTTTPRRPRPASIAGTGVTVTERNYSELRGTTKDSKPPLPKVHTTPKKPSTPKTSGDTPKKHNERLIKSAKASPRVTPKATPLQSPGNEQPPLIRQHTTEIIKSTSDIKDTVKIKTLDDKYDEKKDQGSEKNIISNNMNNSVTLLSDVTTNGANGIQKPDKKNDNDVESDEVVDMSASMISKIRITTEEEAKAALAERRKLAREQAEREAELERQRLEEEERLEEQRQRAEEEQQRRLEIETIRLANEAREAEEQRLQIAIEDAKRREEEDRKRREEEARQKIEKEEADKKAREEAERQRLEMIERQKKEEEERIARRKRVEAIMKRTRGGGGNGSQVNTPTKGDNGDVDKSKDHSPIEDNKIESVKVDDVMTASLITEASQQLINVEKQSLADDINNTTDIVRNGTTHSNGINETNKILLDTNQENGDGALNGHHNNHGNGINTQITLDNATVKNNVTNNLLDLSEFDTLSKAPIMEIRRNIDNDDTINSNLNPMVNPFAPPTTNENTNPFQDSFTKTQEINQVPDLLS